jgi:hypothetical protein
VRTAAWTEVAKTLKTFETPTGFVAPAEVLVAAGAKPAEWYVRLRSAEGTIALAGQRVVAVPNKAPEPTAYSVRYAPASGAAHRQR